MNKTRANKKGGTFSLIVRLSICVFGVYLAISFVSAQIGINEKRIELATQTAQLEEQATQNTELRRTLEQSSETDMVERIARDKLGYARPDERVFVDMSGK